MIEAKGGNSKELGQSILTKEQNWGKSEDELAEGFVNQGSENGNVLIKDQEQKNESDPLTQSKEMGTDPESVQGN
ncbi:hypothetical protein GQ457_06G037690 [Hibiscus cannabinus]